jgi:kynurenine 3-monooxygenase
MANIEKDSRIIIVGAGMGGLLLAIYLSRLGYEIEIYERRTDMRKENGPPGRSINMTLATRGQRALEEVGLLDAVMAITIPLKGRMIHDLDGTRTFQAYGKNGSEAIHSIKRDQLNITLMNAAQALPNVKLFFNKRCSTIDKQHNIIYLQDERTKQIEPLKADIIVGADGAFSTVRQQMHRGERAYYKQDFLDWGFKELQMPAATGNSHQLENDALHIWPRGDHMLLAMPNADGSFTCTCILPFEGEYSFASMKSDEDILGLFNMWFPDAVPLMPNLVTEFMENKISEMITTHTYPWYYKDRLVLIGDSCHAVVPFYGLGMNAAFEDCAVLSDCISRCTGDLEATFAEYQQLRKPNTDVLAELSKQNFIELRQRIESPLFVARKKMEVMLNRVFPRAWTPLYSMMSHTTMPYADALKRSQKQNRIARLCGLDVVLLSAAGAVVAWAYTKKIKKKLERKINLSPPLPVKLPTISSPAIKNTQVETDA